MARRKPRGRRPSGGRGGQGSCGGTRQYDGKGPRKKSTSKRKK